MKDLKFEQKRSLSRIEAADQLTALADALRKGGDAEMELGPSTLSLRIPDDLHTEIEVEIGGGEIELEIELKWPTSSARRAASRTDSAPEEPAKRRSAPAGADRSGTGAARKSAKRSAARTT
ncbi:amphi-Trp domain-containing protein [Streptomyces sp. NPDC005551]|uniref:amphi-Trp domain-containing protein n=1 Tax=unclassified Streptomyces TaxID=2593676 RepID=UPI003409ED40